MKFKPLMISACLFSAVSAAPAQAVDGFSLTVGSSDDDIDMIRAAARFDWDRRWLDNDGNWFLTGHYELSLFYMETDSDDTLTSGTADDLYGLSFAPVLRYQRNPYSNGITPFIEYGIGAAYLSEDKLSNDTVSGSDLGGNFQFENKFSVGMMFGQNQRYELSANFFHYSNAGLEDPNDGIDTYTLSFSMWY